MMQRRLSVSYIQPPRICGSWKTQCVKHVVLSRITFFQACANRFAYFFSSNLPRCTFSILHLNHMSDSFKGETNIVSMSNLSIQIPAQVVPLQLILHAMYCFKFVLERRLHFLFVKDIIQTVQQLALREIIMCLHELYLLGSSAIAPQRPKTSEIAITEAILKINTLQGRSKYFHVSADCQQQIYLKQQH